MQNDPFSGSNTHLGFSLLVKRDSGTRYLVIKSPEPDWDVKFEPKEDQIGFKCDKSGTFSHQISVHFGLPS